MKRASIVPTGEATIGPFFPPRYIDEGANDLTVFKGRKAKGEAMEIHGRVMQEDGALLENLVVEIWQADAGGIYRHPADPRQAQADPNFLGWGRAATDSGGRYRFRTIRPGAPAGRAPHVNVILMASGLMRILNAVPDAAARDRLVARLMPPKAEPYNALIYEHQIVLRGRSATPAQP